MHPFKLKKEVSAMPKSGIFFFYQSAILYKSDLSEDGFSEFRCQKHSFCVEFSELFKNRIHLGVTLLQTSQNKL